MKIEIKNDYSEAINNYFEPKIIERGLKYHRQGKVEILKDNSFEKIFEVYGTGIYTVKLQKEVGNFYNIFCDCPYDNYCKHMVGVLYSLEFGNFKAKSINTKSKVKNSYDYSKFNEFKTKFNVDLNHLYGRNKFIDYNSGYDYVDLIDTYVSNISKEDNSSIDKLLFLLKNVETVNMDGSGGEHSIVIGIIGGKLGELYFHYPTKTKKALIDFFDNKYNVIDISSVIIEFYDKITSKEDAIVYSEFLLEVSNNINEVNIYYYSSRDLDYYYIKTIYNHVDKNKAINIAETYLNNNYNDKITEFLVDVYIDNSEDLKAIKLLKLLSKKDLYGSNNKLLELYKKNNMNDKYESLIFEMYENNPSYELYITIKQFLSPKHFLIMRNSLIDKCNKEYKEDVFIKLCLEEELYDKLFTFSKNKGLEYVDMFAKNFISDYMKEMLEYYKKHILELCERAKHPSNYDKVFYYLSRLSSYKGGKNIALSIIKEAKEKYSTRKLFMEVLNEAEAMIGRKKK